MKIPFVGGSAQARSLNQNAERSINCFLEYDSSNPPRPSALYGTPGMIAWATLGASTIRNCIKQGDFTYWIASSGVYRAAADGTVDACGNIGSSTGPVGLAVNAAGQVLIVDGIGGWFASGTTVTQITDPDFPNGVTSACYLDGYFIVCGDGSRNLFWNLNPDDATAWDGTDFASAESSPDAVIGAIVDHRNIFVFKEKLVEVWQNTGDSAQLFKRQGDAVMEHGAASFPSVQAMNNTLYWLGAGKAGQGIPFMAQGYNPVEIPNSASLEAAMGTYSTIADAFGWCFELQGHAFYALTFPTADATWLYDAKTQQWTELAWRDPADNTLHRHRAACCVFFAGKILVGDFETAEIFELSMDAYDDNGDPLLFLRRTQTMTDGGVRLYFGQGTLDMETGVGLTSGQGSDPLVMLRYSNDGGHTWSNYKQLSFGKMGQYGRQVKIPPTGNGRNRVWEISITDPVKRAVFGADVGVEKGV